MVKAKQTMVPLLETSPKPRMKRTPTPTPMRPNQIKVTKDRTSQKKKSPSHYKLTPLKNITRNGSSRVFIFIHHLAGRTDPLTTSLRVEALAQGIRLKVSSVEKESGTGDLLEDEPYNKHLRRAERGYVDGYHAGYPCSTFSRLRSRKVEGLPGPVRSKEEPYGLKGNTPSAQRDADQGAIMASRAIDMAAAVVEGRRLTTTRAIATLENPPPSWELPEMNKFWNLGNIDTVIFNTCAYEDDLEVGKKHYKPQQFSGTLRGLPSMSKSCSCGSPQNHDTITGPTKSKASATYPINDHERSRAGGGYKDREGFLLQLLSSCQVIQKKDCRKGAPCGRAHLSAHPLRLKVLGRDTQRVGVQVCLLLHHRSKSRTHRKRPQLFGPP